VLERKGKPFSELLLLRRKLKLKIEVKEMTLFHKLRCEWESLAMMYKVVATTIFIVHAFQEALHCLLSNYENDIILCDELHNTTIREEKELLYFDLVHETEQHSLIERHFDELLIVELSLLGMLMKVTFDL
jgi:hypothetical protein